MNKLPVFRGQDLRFITLPIGRRADCAPRTCPSLSLIKPGHTGAVDRANVHEDIFAAIIRLDEAEALLVVEPLHGSLRHIVLLFSYVCNGATQQRSYPTPVRGETKSSSRSSIGPMLGHCDLVARFSCKKSWLSCRKADRQQNRSVALLSCRDADSSERSARRWPGAFPHAPPRSDQRRFRRNPGSGLRGFRYGIGLRYREQ